MKVVIRTARAIELGLGIKFNPTNQRGHMTGRAKRRPTVNGRPVTCILDLDTIYEIGERKVLSVNYFRYVYTKSSIHSNVRGKKSEKNFPS